MNSTFTNPLTLYIALSGPAFLIWAILTRRITPGKKIAALKVLLARISYIIIWAVGAFICYLAVVDAMAAKLPLSDLPTDLCILGGQLIAYLFLAIPCLRKPYYRVRMWQESADAPATASVASPS